MTTLTNVCPRPLRRVPVPVWSPGRGRGRWRGVALAGVVLAAVAVRADVLELRNGQVING